MNFRIFLKTLRIWRIRLAIFCFALMGFEWMIAAMYSSFGKFFLDLPEPIRVFLRIGAGIDFGAGQFLAFGYFHPLWLIVSGAFVISLGVSAVAGDIEKRTISTLLSRPIPRHHLITSRGVFMFLGLAVLMLAGVAGTALGVATVDIGEHVDLTRFLLVAFNGLALFLAIGGYTFLFSSLFDTGGKAASFSVGLTLIFYLINYLAGLWQTVKSLGPFSVFHYFDPGSVVRNGLSWSDIAILLLAAAASFLLALVVLRRRDIAA